MILTDSMDLSSKINQVRFFLVDRITGESLDHVYMPKWKPNAVSPLAAEVAAKCLGGFIDQGAPGGPAGFQVARIEWGSGIGAAGAPMDAVNPDIESPFSPRIFTPLANPEYPGQGVVRFLSYIDDSFFPINQTNKQVQEVALRTVPLSGYPNGILQARYKNDSPILISSSRTRVGVEWIFAYKYI